MEMYIIKYHCTVSLLEDPPNKLASSAACIQGVHTGIINVEFSRVMLLGEMGTNCQCIYTNFITSNSRLLLVNVAPSRPIAKSWPGSDLRRNIFQFYESGKTLYECDEITQSK